MSDTTAPLPGTKAPTGVLGRLEGKLSWIALGLVGLLLLLRLRLLLRLVLVRHLVQ